MKKNRFALLAGAALLLLLPVSARAQFRGDVFFANPSVSVPAGGVAVLEVQMFSGADIVGATHIDVIFDSTKAEVVAVESGVTAELADGLVSAISPGRAGIVTLNGKSLLQPLGTVSLAKVHVKPLVAAGNRVALSIQVRSLLRQDNTPFPNSQGFSGEILVASAAGSALKSGPGASSFIQADGNVAERAWSFRRPGLAVDLLNFDFWDGMTWTRPRRVVVPDAAAPAETP